MAERQNQAPVVTAVVVGLVVAAIAFWGYAGGGPTGPRTATMRHTRAVLSDGKTCMFTADFALTSLWGQWTFARNRLDIRSALVDLVHSKSHYMVETAVERESLGAQMVDVVNTVAERSIVDRVDLPEFELY